MAVTLCYTFFFKSVTAFTLFIELIGNGEHSNA